MGTVLYSPLPFFRQGKKRTDPPEILPLDLMEH